MPYLRVSSSAPRSVFRSAVPLNGESTARGGGRGLQRSKTCGLLFLTNPRQASFLARESLSLDPANPMQNAS